MASLIWLSVTVYGLAIVIAMVVAGVIWAISSVIARGDRPKSSAPSPSAAPTQAGATFGVPPQHMAAIAAAVAAVIGPGFRVVHIEDAQRGGTWTAEGKIMHQTSHRITRRGR